MNFSTYFVNSFGTRFRHLVRITNITELFSSSDQSTTRLKSRSTPATPKLRDSWRNRKHLEIFIPAKCWCVVLALRVCYTCIYNKYFWTALVEEPWIIHGTELTIKPAKQSSWLLQITNSYAAIFCRAAISLTWLSFMFVKLTVLHFSLINNNDWCVNINLD